MHKGIDFGRPTKRIVVFYETRRKTKLKLLNGLAKKNLNLVGITQESVQDREILGSKIHRWQVDQKERPMKKTGISWSD